MPSQRAGGILGCYLEFDLQKIQWIHTEHSNNTCPESSSCMVLILQNTSLSGLLHRPHVRTKAVVGKKLAGCCTMPAIAGRQKVEDSGFLAIRCEGKIEERDWKTRVYVPGTSGSIINLT
jgi:hypothetical protein